MLNAKESDVLAKTCFKNKNIKLIKVPKFVSDKWLKCNHKQVVGLFEHKNDEISNLYIQKEDNEEVKKLRCNKNYTINTYILKQNKIYLKPTKSSNSFNTNVTNKVNENVNKNKLKININNPVKDNPYRNKEIEYAVCANIIKSCDHIYSFLPLLDKEYSLTLKQRHYQTNVKKNRYTIIETRNEENIDSSKTLFKYYTTSNDARDESKDKNVKNNKRPIFENENKFLSLKKKPKHSKKIHVVDLDKTKISMFKIFEREGKNGVPFSLFTKIFSIPSNHIKNVLDEIAVKRKRIIDKKSVYFLKDYIR